MRAVPGNIEFASQMKAGCDVVYRTDHQVETIEAPEYWLPCQNYLKPEDEIKVTVVMDDGTWMKAVFEIIISEKGVVEVEKITDWRHGGKREVAGLIAKHTGFANWHVDIVSGVMVAVRLTKEQALSIVGRPVESVVAA